MSRPASAWISWIVAGPLTATILVLSACSSSGGGGSEAGGPPPPPPPPPPGSVVVSVSPSSATASVNVPQQFTATIENDPTNGGVRWTLSGAGCVGAECGALSHETENPIFYYAPNQKLDPPAVTLTATAIADADASASATITLDQRIVVIVYPESLTIALGDTRVFNASLINDFNGEGVTWSVVGCPTGVACGSFSPVTTPLGTPTSYTAPASVPQDVQATVIATSVADPSQSGTASLRISTTARPIAVSISPPTASVPIAGALDLTATVSNDPNQQGVIWSVAGCTSGPCGTVSSVPIDPPLAGTYGATYGAPSTPQTAVVGDQVTLTATSNEDSGKSASITVTLSAAPINFSTQNVPAGRAPDAVAVADLNADGKVDIAVADQGESATGDDGGVSILVGNGDGTFQAARQFPAGKNPISIAAADLDGNGKLDLVVDGFGDRPTGGQGDLNVLLGNGDGTFHAPTRFSAGDKPFSLLVGDFNRDLKPDVAVSDFGNTSAVDEGGVYLLIGNGDGTLQAPIKFAAGRNPVAIVARDWDSDGNLDLAVADNRDPASTSRGGVTILRGNGDGTFGSASFYGHAGLPTSIAAGDLDNNRSADVVVSSFIAAFGLAKGFHNVLLGNGDGSFQPATTTLTRGGQGSAGLSFPLSAAMADFDGDMKTDVAEVLGHAVTVLLGNGDGTFRGRVIPLDHRTQTFQGRLIFSAQPDPFALAIGDFNADHKPDIVVANMSTDDVSVLLNDSGT